MYIYQVVCMYIYVYTQCSISRNRGTGTVTVGGGFQIIGLENKKSLLYTNLNILFYSKFYFAKQVYVVAK